MRWTAVDLSLLPPTVYYEANASHNASTHPIRACSLRKAPHLQCGRWWCKSTQVHYEVSMWYFTADEHYNHERIIEYCNRPFASVEEMNDALIANHNRVVTSQDITVHIGDVGWFRTWPEALEIVSRLRGNHIFVKGSHDRWLKNNHQFMYRRMIDGQFVVCCHYAMRTWERAHYGSWQLYGHSHGTLPGIGKQTDVGVDCNNFTPVSFDQVKLIMDAIPIRHSVEHDEPVEE